MSPHRPMAGSLRLAAGTGPSLSAGPQAAARWSLPFSFALHAGAVALVAGLGVQPVVHPPADPIEVTFVEPAMASEQPSEPSMAAAEAATEPENEPATEASPPEPATEPIPEPVAAPAPQPPRPDPEAPARPPAAHRPPAKPVRARSVPAGAPKAVVPVSEPDGAAVRAMRSPPAASAPMVAASAPGQPPADYLAVIQARLARHKVYPRPAQLARQEGTVLVRFVVAGDGTVTDWTIVQGSGHDILDRAAGEMIRRASPLPPIPADIGRDRMEITLPVRYALR